MPNKVNTQAFKRLKKLTPKKRMQIANSPAGKSMLALLTPSQFADLFPKQYQRGLPDVGGFRAAISKKSQQKQQDILTGLSSGQGKTLEQAEETGRKIRQATTEGSTGRATGGRTPSSYDDSGPVSKAQMMKYAMDQLRKEGVPEGNLRAAAAHLVGQAYMESGLDPNKKHDKDEQGNYTGFGIYGARKERKDRQFDWLSKNGYANNSAEGQMRYMAHEAMTGGYSKTKKVLMNANENNFDDDAAVITNEFENPKVKNYRGGAVKSAFQSLSAEKAGTPTTPSAGGAPTTGAGPTTSGGGGKYVSPVEGVFGRTSGNVFAADRSQGNRLHAGVDWTAKNGSDVVAPVSGRVLYSGHHTGYQHMIDILGDDGKIHRLAPHGAVGNFKVGQRVEQGQKVGTIDRAHLHYEIIPPSSSVFREMSKGGSFVQTSWFPGQSPKTEDPAQALGIQPGTKVGIGGSLNVQQSQEERTKNSQEALGEIIKANPDHPFSKMIEKKMEIQGEGSLDKASPEKVGEKVDPEQLKVAPVTTSPTAEVLKPVERSFMLDQQGLISAIKQTAEYKEQTKNIPDFMIPDSEVIGGFFKDKRTIKIMQKTGTTYDPATGKVTSKNPDELMKSFGIPTEGVLKPIDKRSEAETGKQTASLMDRVKKEFGGTAQAQEAGDAFAREAEYRKLHVYGPEMPTEKAGVDAVKMRQKIEGYYGRPINDHEYDMLIRATHGESSAKKHNPQEQAMIMGTILNRAKSHKGGIEGALMASRQFESVTGKTRGKFSPNPAYKAGPSARRMESMYEATMQHLHNVSPKQKYFTSEYGDKSSWHEKMKKMPESTVYAGSRFNTSLGKGPATEVAAVPQAPAPSPAPVQDASLGQRIAKELAPVTPAQAATPPAPAPTPAPAPQAPEFPKVTPQGVPTPPTRPTAFVVPPEPVKAPDESSTQNFLRSQGIPAQPVPGASSGGAFDLSIAPMDRRDDHAVINTKTQQPLFTVKSGERINVTPQQKVDGNMNPTRPDYGREMDALRHELSSSMASAGDPPKVQMRQVQQQRSDDPNFGLRQLNANKNKQYHNPAFERAMNRTRMQETGDTLNGHFSGGNTNY